MPLSQAIPIACAVISALCAVFVAWRADRWRKSDAAKDHMSTLWQQTEIGRSVISRLGAVEGRASKAEGRLDSIDEKFEDLPTEADIARLEGEIGTVKELCRAAAAGVQRIENFMMQGNRG